MNQNALKLSVIQIHRLIEKIRGFTSGGGFPPGPPHKGEGRTQRTDIVFCIMHLHPPGGVWGGPPFASALCVRPLHPLSASALCVHYHPPPFPLMGGPVGNFPPQPLRLIIIPFRIKRRALVNSVFDIYASIIVESSSFLP